MGFFGFWGCSLLGGQKSTPSLNLAQLYLTQRRSKKYMNHVTHPFSSADISIFSPEISKICYIKKYRYRLYFDTWFLSILTFLESLYIVIVNMVKILMMSAKMATTTLLKRLLRHIFFIWRHKENFVTWLKFILCMWSGDQSLVTLAFV